MAQVKVYHYRDHNNGGKFDGNCFVSGGAVIGAYSYVGVRCRFRFNSFSTGPKSIWSVGASADNNQWALKVHVSHGTYFFRVTYLDVNYDFSNYELEEGVIYEVLVRHISNFSGDIVIEISDQWHNLLYTEQKTNTSDGVTYTLYTGIFFIGATYTSSAIEKFIGTIFDWETLYSSTTDRQRLVFYEQYDGTNNNIVYDFYNKADALVWIRPSDFWPSKTDISDHITDQAGGFNEIRYNQDKYRTPQFNSTSFGLCTENWDDISVGDTITIEYDNKIIWVFNVSKIQLEKYKSKTIYLEDILQGLSKITSENFSSRYFNLFNATDTHWWSNYVPDTSSYDEQEYYFDVGNERRRWFSITYILQLVFYVLQYDNILSISVASIKDVSSDYLYNTTLIKYKYLALHQGMLSQMGYSASSNTGNTTMMDKVFRELLKALRLTYFISSDTIQYYKITCGTVSVDNDDNYDDKGEEDNNRKFHQIKAYILDSGYGYPDWAAYYTSFGSGDIGEITKNNLDSVAEIVNEDRIDTIVLMKHYWLCRRDNYSNDLRELSYTGAAEFPDQFADILDAALRGKMNIKAIKTVLLSSNSPNYYKKIDNLVEKTTEVKQVV